MPKQGFLAAKDKQGKSHFIATEHIVQVVEIDTNSWQIDLVSGAFTIVDSFEAQRLLKKLAGLAREAE